MAHQFAGFTLTDALGRGATATVWLASKDGGPQVALKILQEEQCTDQMVQRFRREIDAMRKLDHPRILRIFDAGQEGDRLWYSMEYLRKKSLEDVLKDRHAGGGILTMEEFLTLARGLGDSLGYLHDRQLVHRDLKPDNLLVDDDFDPTLMDFGLAKDFERSEMTAEGMIMGTPRYMAPEQVQGRDASFPADVYQVGLILYRALTGGLPLEDENPFSTAMRRMREAIPPPSGQRPNIPPGVDRILLQCLRFQAGDRYPNMRAFAEDLAKLDPKTGNLKPGETMPGSLAERPMAGEGTAISTSTAGFQAAAKAAGMASGGTMVGRGKSDVSTLPKGGGTSDSKGPLLAAAGLIGAVLMGLVLAMGGGAASTPAGLRPSNLRAEVVGGAVQLSFDTAQPATSMVRLDPPDGDLIPFSEDEPSTVHAGTLPGIDPGDTVRYQVVLVDAEGTRHTTPEDSFQVPQSGEGMAITENDHGDRATLKFRTPEAARCVVRFGEGDALDRVADERTSGGRTHVFELRGLDPDVDVRYQIEVTAGGATKKAPVRTIRRGAR